MSKFRGFTQAESFTPLPDSFFSALLRTVDSLEELKVVLASVWLTEHMEGSSRTLSPEEFAPKELGLTAAQVHTGLGRAVEHGVLLVSGEGTSLRYALNSPRGRASMGLGTGAELGSQLTSPRFGPSVFRLYEENIGPLTPLIADALKGAEADYSEAWVADAIQVAVANNKRSWAYCEAILRRWKDEGRAEKQNRRDDKAARQRDVENKIRKFIDG